MNKFFWISVPVLLAIIAVLLVENGNKDPSWYPTEDGAIRVNAYDFMSGKIDVSTAFKQDGTCKNSTDNLEASGIDTAIGAASGYQNLEYYYYKANAYVQFYKIAAPTFTLTLFESPAYFKAPRIVPGPADLADKMDNVDMAAKLRLAAALKGSDGKPKAFTANQLADAIEGAVGKQTFDLEAWVIANVFDKDARSFMACVPNVDKLVETTFDANAAQQLQGSLKNAEHDMRGIITKASGWGS